MACVAGEEIVTTSIPEPVLENDCFVESIVAIMGPEELEVSPAKVVTLEMLADKPAEPLTVNELKLGKFVPVIVRRVLPATVIVLTFAPPVKVKVDFLPEAVMFRVDNSAFVSTTVTVESFSVKPHVVFVVFC